ncbi:MAG: MotA/TolQ/ExbB proton channel family protein [Kiritimatiellae bacterium]|nr:MotA/TolQ/ExbB proton channel family protein [Kiritimatiellia bacterium]MCO5060872.1 MotA/TolQ/ExbB proton channel family protein [Kiritimatiellia bacterium]MCO5069409.1 MotA/TolQ/ExbB proton channel family protein [Kiritimatiellia bacterium]
MKLFKGIALTLAGWLAANVAFSDAAATAPSVPEAESMTIQQIIETGGWLMYVLAAMSFVGVALVIYFLIALRRNQIIPTTFVDSLRTLLREGRFVEAQTACRNNGSAIASISGSALDYVLRSPKPDSALLREIVEGEGGRQATMIQNQTQYLMDIGVIAPMIGLLGTVVGMLKAFNTVALDLTKAKPMLLAQGVSQALITTVGGLVVAIPAMIAYAYFRGRTSRLISDLEKNSAELITLMDKDAR